MDDEFALLLGYSVLRHSHINRLSRHYEETDAIPHDFSEYVQYLTKGLIEPNTNDANTKKNILCNRMKPVYEKIHIGYMANTELSRIETEKRRDVYENIVIKKNSKLTEAQDPYKIDDITHRIDAAYSIAGSFARISDFTPEFIKSDWDKHFLPFEKAEDELKNIRSDLNSKIEKVEDASRKKHRITLAIIAIVLTLLGGCITFLLNKYPSLLNLF